MRAIVTCGPSYEPIDEVRRLTNFSTGELGTLLAEALVRRGIETVCLRGSGSTYRAPGGRVDVRAFATNDDLIGQLRQCAGAAECEAVFHSAALCDYRPAAVLDDAGRQLHDPKIPSRAGALTLRLEPTTKVISNLRGWFPKARIIGWKYELNGTATEAEARAKVQMAENRTDACVLNGRAAGEGFTLIGVQGDSERFLGKEALCEALALRFVSA